MNKNYEKYYKIKYNEVYPLYIQKLNRKNRTIEELDEVIMWLTGYTIDKVKYYANNDVTFEEFFKNAPKVNPNKDLVKGMICGVRIEEIDDDLAKNMRILDKLVDELYKGKPLEKILR